MSQDLPRPLTEHLTELRSRLIWTVSVWATLSAVAFAFKEDVFRLLMGPAVSAVLAKGYTLKTISPPELFLSYIKASLLGGFLLSLPVSLYQVWAFIAPGLYSTEKRLALPFVFATTLLFLSGNLFGYFVAFPFVFDFFLELEADFVTTEWTTASVFSFMSRLYLAFGLSFQLPIVMFFLANAGIVSVEQLSRMRPYAAVAMFVVGALLTPPDVVSQIALAIPLMLLYEAGILSARITLRRREAEREAATS